MPVPTALPRRTPRPCPSALLLAGLLAILASSSLAHGVSPDTYLVGTPTSDSLLVVDPASPANAVFQVTDAAGILHVELTHVTFVPPTTHADRHNRWLVYRSGTALFRLSLLKPGPLIPIQLSTESATPLATEPGIIALANLTTNRIAYQVATATASTIKTLPKAGGAATVLDQGTLIDPLVLWPTHGTFVYYNKSNAVSGAALAVTVGEDGTGKADAAEALWVGLTLPATCDLATTDLCSVPDKLIRAERPGLRPASLGGAALNSYAAGTTQTVARIGTLPAGSFLVFALSLVGDKALAPITARDGLSFSTNLYYFDAAIPDSLVKVNPGLILGVTVNQAAFSAGQTVTAGIDITSPGLPGSADLYIGILLPDGHTIAFFSSPTTIAIGSADNAASFTPHRRGRAPDAALLRARAGLLLTPVDGRGAVGSYILFFLAVKAGLAADGILAGDEILGLATTSFSFL